MGKKYKKASNEEVFKMIMDDDVNLITGEGTLSGLVLEFLEERDRDGDRLWPKGDDDDDEHEHQSHESKAANKAFWEKQYQLLEEAFAGSGSMETRIKSRVEKSLERLRNGGNLVCTCSNRSSDKESCRSCIMREISNSLRDAGYNSATCRSKWRRSLDIPSGEHKYVDVVMNTKKGSIRVLIDVNFRAEFEMARASAAYNGLVGRLPEVFVGKSDRLRAVVKIMCDAAKKCMKENKMHMAPWRKHKYMQSKWLAACERIPLLLPPPPPPATVADDRRSKPRASMLTFDLHCPAVEVV